MAVKAFECRSEEQSRSDVDDVSANRVASLRREKYGIH